MHSRILACFSLAVAFAFAWQPVDGQHLHPHHRGRPLCEPCFKVVEEIEYRDIERFVCKTVHETKKKWVYDWINDPFCIHDKRHGDCPQCYGPYCRKQLVKFLIEEPCPVTKCVTERIVERVPVVVYRKVPCTTNIETIPIKPTPVKPMPLPK